MNIELQVKRLYWIKRKAGLPLRYAHADKFLSHSYSLKCKTLFKYTLFVRKASIKHYYSSIAWKTLVYSRLIRYRKQILIVKIVKMYHFLVSYNKSLFVFVCLYIARTNRLLIRIESNAKHYSSISHRQIGAWSFPRLVFYPPGFSPSSLFPTRSFPRQLT